MAAVSSDKEPKADSKSRENRSPRTHIKNQFKREDRSAASSPFWQTAAEAGSSAVTCPLPPFYALPVNESSSDALARELDRLAALPRLVPYCQTLATFVGKLFKHDPTLGFRTLAAHAFPPMLPRKITLHPPPHMKQPCPSRRVLLAFAAVSLFAAHQPASAQAPAVH